VTAPELVGMSPRYTILREVGHGSTARVYLAEDQQQGRQVAVKVMRKELAASVVATRFLREIRYIRGLRHPNILPILDAAEQGDLLYFVMPYAEGQTLRARLTLEGALPFSDVLRVASAVADALDYAHAHNVVHRDLKPENILFDEERVILCDFGVARAIVLSSTEDRLSSSGIALGTPSYMSPEQTLMDHSIDGRCDIYALGCVVYEMLTGELPFNAVGAIARALAHVTLTPRPIRTVRPEVPKATEAAVFWAMSKAVENRPPSGRAFIERLLASLPIGTTRRFGGA
jgi:eukaryotic-like serine/threonine-protein kinase